MNTYNKTNNNNNNNKKIMSTTPFCKVCQDAGKLEKEYRSHNVRDARGTCCPLLLSQECKNCFKTGHTIKYCTQLKLQAVAVTVAAVKPTTIKQVKPSVPKNIFMCLDSESESDNESDNKKEKVRTEPASVSKTELKIAQKQALNYDKIIKIAPIIVAAETAAHALKAAMKASENKVAKIVVSNQAAMKAPFKWADCDTDSGGSEDETYENSW